MVKISAARIDLEGGRIDNAMLKYYAETLVGGASGTNTGSAYTIDLSTGSAFYLILNANCTFNFSNPSASGTASGFTLILKQDGTGGRGVTWPYTVAWERDSIPVPSTAANTWYVLYFFTVDGGATWYGNQSGDTYS
jgi:hypothetical protein